MSDRTPVFMLEPPTGATGDKLVKYDHAAGTVTWADGSTTGGVQSVVAGTGVTVDDTDPANPVVSATGSTDPEVVRDTVAAALVAGTNITITPDDAGNTITIAATAPGGGSSAYTIRETLTTPPGATAAINIGGVPADAGGIFLWIDKLLAMPGVDYTIGTVDGVTKLTLTSSAAAGKKLHLAWPSATATPPASSLVADNSYFASVLADQPWGFWTQTETTGPLADSSGNNHQLNITGAPTAFAQPGPKSSVKAIDWPANTGVYARSAATIGTASAASVGQSFECWVYLTANPSGQLTLMQVGDNATGSGFNNFALYVNSNGTVGGYFYGGGVLTFNSVATLPLNQWNHIVFSAKTGAVKIRVNKVDFVSSTSTAFLGYTNTVWVHGGWNTTAQAAKIAAPAFYQTALSSAQIDSHYDAA